jgi:oxygen-independent coproporphyrinogen-3 oxidase
MGEWVGLGPSAASQHRGWRGSNVADLPEWAALVGRGERMTRERTALNPALLVEDALVFGLRMNAGVDVSRLWSRCPGAPRERVEELVDRLAAEGLVARDGPRLRLEPRGRLLADSIGSEIMVAFDLPAAAKAGPA